MTQPKGTNTRSLGVVIVGGVIGFFLLALVGAFFLSGGTDDGSTEVEAVAGGSSSATSADGAAQDGTALDGEEVATIDIAGEALSRLPEGVRLSDSSNDPAVGQLAPTLSGTDFAGESVEIGPGGGPKVVLFLAHWCPHCQREMPLVNDLIAAGKLPPDVEVYAVSTAVDLSRGNPPSAWFANEGWNQSVVRDNQDNSAFVSYGGAGFPYVVYLDSENRVLTRTAGELGADAIEDLWLAIAGS